MKDAEADDSNYGGREAIILEETFQRHFDAVLVSITELVDYLIIAQQCELSSVLSMTIL